MPTGLRASDAPTLQRLCGSDQRLFLRIGQLLQAKLAFTEPALGEIVGNEALKKLALDKRMREVDATSFATLLAEHGGDGDLVLVDGEGEAGWRVIAVVDELGNPLLAPAPAEVGGAAILATLSPALRAPVEGLLHAGGDEQRAAALEQLRYAAPPLSVVSELMPMLLADGAELVRERAINLLVAAGAQIAVIDLVRALQRGDLAQLGRIADAVSNLA
nr:hypothetical protein [Planctomycetota bacterium]